MRNTNGMKQRVGSIEPFPASVYEFARIQNLGVPLAEHRWGFSCLEALVMPILGFWPIFTVLILPSMFSVSLANALAGLPGLLLILVIDIACICYFVICFRRRSSWRVYVFTNGFAYFKGTKREVFRWEEVSHVREHVTVNRYGRPIFYVYRVERADGYRITLNYHFRDVYNLGRTIMQHSRHT
jgi:hypothetical protein